MYQLTCNTLPPIVWKNPDDCLFRIKDSSVWKLRINELISSVDHLFSLLHQEEKNKASLFKFEKDKKAYIIRWGILKLLLAKYVQKDPSDIRLIKGENNKPLLLQQITDTPLFFNLSHSDDLVLIAISEQEIGIDAEKINRTIQYSDLLATLFTDHEKEMIIDAADPYPMFYTYFTRKESVAKATAKGISDSIADIPVCDGKHLIHENNVCGIKTGLQVNSFFIDDDYTASLTVGDSLSVIEFYSAGASLLQ